ncbi:MULTISPECIES: hypothetical protein [Gallibacterium]|nr:MULTISPECIES: hypothetical protein [Gallibacterium]WKS98586.1 hypothetical protein NYR30_07285 [Gallibacterium salpingitidis]
MPAIIAGFFYSFSINDEIKMFILFIVLYMISGASFLMAVFAFIGHREDYISGLQHLLLSLLTAISGTYSLMQFLTHYSA